jgi:hypothetical protein
MDSPAGPFSFFSKARDFKNSTSANLLGPSGDRCGDHLVQLYWYQGPPNIGVGGLPNERRAKYVAPAWHSRYRFLRSTSGTFHSYI